MDYQDVDLDLAVEFAYEEFEDEALEDAEAESAAPADPQTFYLALKGALDHIKDQLRVEAQQIEA